MNKRETPISLNDRVLFSIVQKLPPSIGDQMKLELVSQTFAQALRTASYSNYHYLKIECGAAKDDDDDDHDDEELVDDGEEKDWLTDDEDIFRINIYRGDDWTPDHTPKDPIKCLAAIFARALKIHTLTMDSYQQWQVNEMILRAVIIAKCEMLKIKTIFMNIPYIPEGKRVDNVIINTPALFADSLRWLYIEDLSRDTFHDISGYFGTYLKSINLRILTLRSLELPLSSFGFLDCLPKYFGHMFNLRNLTLSMRRRQEFVYPMAAYPGTVEFLSKLRSFILELDMFVPVDNEDDPQFDAYISLCKRLPESVGLCLRWTNHFNYRKPEELNKQIACALRMSSQTRARVTLYPKNTYYGSAGYLQVWQQWANCISKIIQKNRSLNLSVFTHLTELKSHEPFSFRVTLKGNMISFDL